MSRKKEVSIRQIAKECGVSTATVSRVINDPDKVSEATRNKIISILESYNYSASTEKKPFTILDTPLKIGILITSSISFYYTELLQNIYSYFMERGVLVVSANTQEWEDYVPSALESLYTSNVSGIIMISCDYYSLRDLLKPEIPCVWIDCNDPPEDSEGIPQVQTDHYVSGQLAAQELINKGCRTPIILTSADPTHRGWDRINGFRSIMEKHGLEMKKEQIVYLPYIKHHFLESRDMVQYLITKGMDFDSIFAINDWRSLGALVGVQNCGLTVPKDIRIVGFDGISMVCNTIMNITSIQQNTRLLARNACTLLEKQLYREKSEELRIIVPPNLVVGQTT